MNKDRQFMFYLLLLSLCLQSCFTKLNLPIEKPSSNIQELSHQDYFRQLSGKQLFHKQGYIVTFYEKNGQSQAIIKEGHGSLHRTHILPVYIESVACLAHIMRLDETQQKQLVDMRLPQNGQKGYVYIGNIGLMGGGNINTKDQGDWPLHRAAENGKLKATKLLLDRGAEVNAKNKDGNTPLHLATAGGHVKIVKLLIKNGADLNAKDNNGDTPLHLATAGSHVLVMGLVLLHRHVITKLLLENGADVNARNGMENTPLHLAVTLDDRIRTKLLLEYGADVNAKNSVSDTPLHLAAKWINEKVIVLLIEHGADIHAKNDVGNTPLYL
ncbi:MAG: ankyrin repeat domain-containing protein [Candidatus Amoebophilus sp.]